MDMTHEDAVTLKPAGPEEWGNEKGFGCAKLHVKDTDLLINNPKSMKALECVWLTTSVSDQGSGSKFLDCMKAEEIALDDPAVTSILTFMPPEKCFNRRLPPDASVEDARSAINQRLLCLTYKNSEAKYEVSFQHFICVIPEDMEVETTDKEILIEYYR